MRVKKRKKKFVKIILIISIISLLLYIDNNFLQVTHFEVKSMKIPKSFQDFKILQISDLHDKSFGNNNVRLIAKISQENPDMIVFTGDMINARDKDYHVFLKLAASLGKKYKVYYVIGNHEQVIDIYGLNQLVKEMRADGIRILNNEKIVIKKGSESINLYGLWFNLRYYKDANNKYTKDIYFGTPQIHQILGDLDPSEYNILLTHNPLYFKTYAGWGADLTLAGHVHGGVIRIPFVGGLFSPEKQLFPKYDSGEYFLNGKELIVNRGLGNSYLGFRLFNQPEITVITLSKKTL